MRFAVALLLVSGLGVLPAYGSRRPLITATELHRAHPVAILDARSDDKYEAGHLPGAISLPWVDLSKMPKSPAIEDIDKVVDQLNSKGVPSRGWLVVYGDGKDGWGEEGRLWWTLEYLGQREVTVLDGGLPAWKKAGYSLSTEGPGFATAKFQAAPVAKYRIELPALKKAIAAKKVQVLDVRDPDEYAGARKFGEPRGGHLPGAINLPWKQFLADDGRLLSPAKIRKLLAAHGIDPKKRVVVYCTGGIRSGFAFFALRVADLNVANFDGSFWAWAADPTLPLE